MPSDFTPSDFYVTCATVIPVLFLAAAVQGGTIFAKILALNQQAVSQALEARETVSPKWYHDLPPVASVGFAGSGAVILIAGGVGEGFALFTLFRHQEIPGGRWLVLVSSLVLVAAVVAGPLPAILDSRVKKPKDPGASA
jgi:hypothetical protein